MTYTRAAYVIGGVLALHAAGLLFGLYTSWLWYDIPMHFLGGFAMGALGLALLKKGPSFWHDVLFVIGFVSLISILWEQHEFLLDVLLAGSERRQLGIADTMADFFFDLSGGLVALVLFYERT